MPNRKSKGGGATVNLYYFELILLAMRLIAGILFPF